MRRREQTFTVESRLPREDLRLVLVNDHKPYGALSFCIDITAFIFSGGLWGIWIFVREMRRR